MSKKAEFWTKVNELRKKGLSEMDIRKELGLWIPKKYKEAEFISEMIYGTGGDYDARNRNRINVIKLLYFKEDEEE